MKNWKGCPDCWGTGLVGGFQQPCEKQGSDYAYAEGGFVKGVPVFIDRERGPELFVPEPPQVVINVVSNVSDDDDAITRILEANKDKIRELL